MVIQVRRHRRRGGRYSKLGLLAVIFIMLYIGNQLYSEVQKGLKIDARAYANSLAEVEQGLTEGKPEKVKLEMFSQDLQTRLKNSLNTNTEDVFITVEGLIKQAEETERERVINEVQSKGDYTNPTGTDFYDPTDDIAEAYNKGVYDKYKTTELDDRIETNNGVRGVYLHSVAQYIQTGSVTLDVYGTEQVLDLNEYKASKYNLANTGIRYDVQEYALYDGKVLDVTYTVTNAEGNSNTIEYKYTVDSIGQITNRQQVS